MALQQLLILIIRGPSLGGVGGGVEWSKMSCGQFQILCARRIITLCEYKLPQRLRGAIMKRILTLPTEMDHRRIKSVITVPKVNDS